MKVINLFAGPGAGKSTTCAKIFANLKDNKILCELVTEYAKDVVWEKRYKLFEDQLYITAKQNRRLQRLLDHGLQYAITDSPILLGLIYNNHKYKNLDNLVLEIFNSYDNINFLLTRQKEYVKIGRNQTEEEAKNIDFEVEGLLNKYNIQYKKVSSVEEILSNI